MMNKKDKIDEELDYRGYHVDFYFDDPGQQIYTVFEGEEIGFGAYNSNYIDDMKHIIDNKLDVVTRFPELKDQGVYGAELRWFDNNGYDDLQLTHRSRVIKIYLLDGRDKFVGPQKEIILSDAKHRLLYGEK